MPVTLTYCPYLVEFIDPTLGLLASNSLQDDLKKKKKKVHCL